MMNDVLGNQSASQLRRRRGWGQHRRSFGGSLLGAESEGGHGSRSRGRLGTGTSGSSSGRGRCRGERLLRVVAVDGRGPVVVQESSGGNRILASERGGLKHPHCRPKIVVGLETRLGGELGPPVVVDELHRPFGHVLALARLSTAWSHFSGPMLRVFLANLHRLAANVEEPVVVKLIAMSLHVLEGRHLQNEFENVIIQFDFHELRDQANLSLKVLAEVLVADPKDVGVVAQLPPRAEKIPGFGVPHVAFHEIIKGNVGIVNATIARQEPVQGHQRILGSAADVDVLAALRDVPGVFMGLEEAGIGNLVGIDVLPQILTEDFPRHDLSDLSKVHVSTLSSCSELVTDLRNPGGAALWVRCDENVGFARGEGAPESDTLLCNEACHTLLNDLQDAHGAIRG
mmetsp:Transcript_59953/g.126930  ORF Transcript_59953/g.126930 Transcript_59953/m.126930 type:complete len:400 (+) Transcript_59953:117-1316(+)